MENVNQLPEILNVTVRYIDYKNSTKDFLSNTSCPFSMAVRRTLGLNDFPDITIYVGTCDAKVTINNRSKRYLSNAYFDAYNYDALKKRKKTKKMILKLGEI